jgi:hypothetical protein
MSDTKMRCICCKCKTKNNLGCVRLVLRRCTKKWGWVLAAIAGMKHRIGGRVQSDVQGRQCTQHIRRLYLDGRRVDLEGCSAPHHTSDELAHADDTALSRHEPCAYRYQQRSCATLRSLQIPAAELRHATLLTDTSSGAAPSYAPYRYQQRSCATLRSLQIPAAELRQATLLTDTSSGAAPRYAPYRYQQRSCATLRS